MAAMLSAVWISCALVIVALAICFATVVATPKSTSAGVALNTLHPPHAPAVIKRRLKRTTAIEDTETSEERTPTFLNSEMEPFLDKLKSISATIDKQSPRNLWWLTPEFSDRSLKLDKLAKPDKLDTEGIKLFNDQRFQEWHASVKRYYKKFGEPYQALRNLWWLTPNFSDRKFLRLKLDKLAKPDELAKPDKLDTEGIKLFNDQRFQEWRLSVKRYYNKFLEPYKKMLKTLKRFYGNDDTLVKLLAAAIKTNSEKEVAERLLLLKLRSMKNNGKTANELFALLELENLNDELFASPLFSVWVEAIARSHPKTSTDKMVILSTLRDYHPKTLTPLLVAGSKLETSEGMLAFNLLETLLSARFNHDITMDEIYKDLELTDLNEIIFYNPRFLLWLNFFKARYQEGYQQGSEAAMGRAKMDDKKLMSDTPLTKEEKAKKAEEAFEVDTLSFLREQFDNDHSLRSVLFEGSQARNTEVKMLYTKLVQRLDKLTTEKS